MKIKALKKRPFGEDESDNKLERLKEAIIQIYEKNTRIFSFEELYRYVEFPCIIVMYEVCIDFMNLHHTFFCALLLNLSLSI